MTDPSSLDSDLHVLLARVRPADPDATRAAQERQATLTKPPGALGELEELSVRLAGVYGTPRPDPRGAAVVVCAGDHGVTAEGVSAFPASVTPAMILNFLTARPEGTGGAAVNAIARSVGASVYVLDVGVNADLPREDALIDAKVRRGTRNLRRESAMTRSETLRAVLAGASAAARACEEGAAILVPGEMGIGNTTPATAITARLLNVDPAEVTGRGTGIDDERLAHKAAVVRGALARQGSVADDPLGVMADLGGYELAAMLGVMLEGAARRRALVLDGFVEGASALVAVALCPAVRDFLFPAGLCAERGHAAQLSHLGLRPLFDLGLRLGEGTGGVLAVPILRAAAATLREMATFAEAAVPDGTAVAEPG